MAERLRGLPGGTVFEAAASAVDAPYRIPPLGGAGGGAFDDTQAAVLIGVRVTTGPVFGNPCITSIQPIFRDERRKFDGAVHGKGEGKSIVAEAKDGYAVGAIVVKTGLAVDGLKLVFMRIKGSGLDPSERYDSEWLGGRGGSPETPLGGDGRPLIGLQGRCGGGLDALGAAQ